MRIKFSPDVLEDGQHHRYLDEILGSVEDGWHVWEIDNPDVIESSRWFEGARQHIHTLFEKATMATHYPRQGLIHSRLWVVCLRNLEKGSLFPDQAAIFFRRPLSVHVENMFTDGTFVKAVLETLAPPKLKTFLEQCKGEPLKFVHGGGNGELKKIVEAHIAEASESGVPLRMIVITDSDARFPGDISTKANEIAELCRQESIDFVVLKKRAIENYIPDEVLLGWVDEPQNKIAKPRIEALCQLTADQRNHLQLKDRFPKEFNTEEERTLFEKIEPSSVTLLQERGLGKKAVELLNTHRSYATPEAFRSRDGNNELDRLVEMIAQSL